MASCQICNGTGCCPGRGGKGMVPAPVGQDPLPCAKCFGSGTCLACAKKCPTPSSYEKPAREASSDESGSG
jgi:hypothetical protein